MRVVLAHRHALIREGIAFILSQAGFEVVGEAETMDALCQQVKKHNPGIVIMDWELPRAIDTAIQLLVESNPDTAIVILTRPQAPEHFHAAMRTGISGYLSVNLSSEEFVSSLRILARGGVVVSQEMASQLKEELTSERHAQPQGDLSNREREVLALVASGATNREIASTLVLTENTIKVHLRNILSKLNLRNRQQAAAYAAQEGVIENIAIESETEEKLKG
jgi:DNA-binding NarL/FixJ family response regulator